jgi:hypothetical protein
MTERKKGGMRAADGSTDLSRRSVFLDPETIRIMRRLGGGNLSAGIRAAGRLERTVAGVIAVAALRGADNADP